MRIEDIEEVAKRLAKAHRENDEELEAVRAGDLDLPESWGPNAHERLEKLS